MFAHTNILTVRQLLKGVASYYNEDLSTLQGNGFLKKVADTIKSKAGLTIEVTELRYILARMDFESNTYEDSFNDSGYFDPHLISTLFDFLSNKKKRYFVTSLYKSPDNSLTAIITAAKYLQLPTTYDVGKALKLGSEIVQSEISKYRMLDNLSPLNFLNILSLIFRATTVKHIIQNLVISEDSLSNLRQSDSVLNLTSTTKRRIASQASSQNELKKFKTHEFYDNYIQQNIQPPQYSSNSSTFLNMHYSIPPTQPTITSRSTDYQYQNHLTVHDTLNEGAKDIDHETLQTLKDIDHETLQTLIDIFNVYDDQDDKNTQHAAPPVDNPEYTVLNISNDTHPDSSYTDYTNEEVQLLNEIYSPIQETNIHNTTLATPHLYDIETYNQYGPLAFTPEAQPEAQPSIYQHRAALPSHTSYLTQHYFMNEARLVTPTEELFNRYGFFNPQPNQTSENHEENHEETLKIIC